MEDLIGQKFGRLTVLEFSHRKNKKLSSKEYLKKASELIPDIKDDKQSFKSLSDLLVDALKHIETLKDLTKGEENLIGNIAENLQTSAGLIIRQIK